MIEQVKFAVHVAIKLANNWYVLGLIGWALIVMNYPIDTVLPRYAG